MLGNEVSHLHLQKVFDLSENRLEADVAPPCLGDSMAALALLANRAGSVLGKAETSCTSVVALVQICVPASVLLSL